MNFSRIVSFCARRSVGAYRSLAVLSVCAISALAGCSSNSSTLTLTSTDRQKSFEQDFSNAWVCTSANGDCDVVLVHDTSTEDVRPNGPLKPTRVSPRQVVHVRVFWQPQRGTVVDHPAATNAAIEWYVFGGDQPGRLDLIEYTGTGLVMVDTSGDRAKVTVSNAVMKPSAALGAMTDPMGPSTLAGSIAAKMDARQVSQVLAELKTAQTAEEARASADISGAVVR